jgi:hypothetical protein
MPRASPLTTQKPSLRQLGAELLRDGLPVERRAPAADDGDAGLLEQVAALPVEPDGRIVDFLEQFRIAGVAPGDEGRARLRQPLLLARQVEVRAPVQQGGAGLGTDAAHGFQPAPVRREDVARVAAEFREQAVERDGADVGQVVHDHERLPLVSESVMSWERAPARAALKVARSLRLTCP